MPSSIWYKSRPYTSLMLAAVALAMLVPQRALAQYPYPPPYPYPYHYAGGYGADIRLAVKPKNAAVYVDGYYAGTVDDFDGTFQRLRIEAGAHELVIYLPGYRSIHQNLYVGPGGSQKVSGVLERLAPGEPDEGQPVPRYPPADPDRDRQSSGPPPDQQGASPPQPQRSPQPQQQAQPGPPPPDRAASPVPSSSRSGTLSVLVDPGYADVQIDGQRWKTAGKDEFLLIQLDPGRHVVEIKRNGYRPFSTEVNVQAGETLPLVVTLTKER